MEELNSFQLWGGAAFRRANQRAPQCIAAFSNVNRPISYIPVLSITNWIPFWFHSGSVPVPFHYELGIPVPFRFCSGSVPVPFVTN